MYQKHPMKYVMKKAIMISLKIRYTYMKRNIATILSSLGRFSKIDLISFVKRVMSINFKTLGSLTKRKSFAKRV